MEEQTKPQQTWVQKNKRFLVIAIIVITIILFALTIIRFGWDWTGLTSVTGPTVHQNEQYRPAKTLWDVLQLLIVPIILVIAGFWLNQIQKSREEKSGEKRAKTEQNIAIDSQREAAYQAYLDHMSDLFLKEHFSVSKPPPEVCFMGRARTLAVLRRLDGQRKECLLLFLSESNLYKTIGLSYADLSGIDLREIRLRDADLSGADLSGADLSGADLSGANLCGADLRRSTSSEFGMMPTNLSGADLRGADLSKTDLSKADLSKAKYNMQEITKKDEKGQPVIDEQGNPVMLGKTKWPDGFVPQTKGANCVDCQTP